MAADNPRNNSRRKPTKRAAARPATRADSHYSKLTRTSTMGSTERRSGGGTGHTEARRRGTRPANGAKRHPKPTRATGASRGGRPVTGYKSLSSDAQRRVYGNRAPRRPRTGNTAALLVGLAVITALVGGGILFWTHRSVNLTVNGSPEKIRVGSTLEGLYEELAISTKAGNYIAVDGEVIEEEKGYAFSASVDGKALTRRQTNEYRIHGGEHIEFSDGGDRMEKYDTEYREVQPKLIFEGSWGSVSFVKQWGKMGTLEMRTGMVERIIERTAGAMADAQISDAEKAKEEALTMKAEYEQNMAQAREKANDILANAQKTASAQSEEILQEANLQAKAIKAKAESDIAQERKKAVNDIKNEIGSMAMDIAGKVIEREISEEDHRKLIDEYIQNVGEAS